MHTQSIIYKWNRVCKLIVQRQMSVSRYATCIDLNEWPTVMISAMAPTFRKGFLHPSSGLLKKLIIGVSSCKIFGSHSSAGNTFQSSGNANAQIHCSVLLPHSM
jgi:hypothetical protein